VGDINKTLVQQAFPMMVQELGLTEWQGMDGARPFWQDRSVMEAPSSKQPPPNA
jgi:hypothetical protein